LDLLCQHSAKSRELKTTKKLQTAGAKESRMTFEGRLRLEQVKSDLTPSVLDDDDDDDDYVTFPFVLRMKLTSCSGM